MIFFPHLRTVKIVPIYFAGKTAVSQTIYYLVKTMLNLLQKWKYIYLNANIGSVCRIFRPLPLSLHLLHPFIRFLTSTPNVDWDSFVEIREQSSSVNP